MASIIPWIIMLCAVFMVLFAFALIFWPILKPKSGNLIDNAMMRSRSILIDREKFGVGEVVCRYMQGSNKSSFRVRLESGGELTTRAYEKEEIEPLDIFQVLCDPLPAVFMTRKDKAMMEGKSREVELIDKITELNKAIDKWESDYKKLASDIDYQVEQRINAQIELAKANKISKPMART